MSLRDGIDRSASAAGVDLQPMMQASSPGIIKLMVAEAIGIGLLTIIDVVDEVRLGRLVFVPVADRDLPVSYLSLMVPSNRYMTAAAALMVRHLTNRSMRSRKPIDRAATTMRNTSLFGLAAHALTEVAADDLACLPWVKSGQC